MFGQRLGQCSNGELLLPAEVTRIGQVWAYRRGEPVKGPTPDPYKDWDGGDLVGQNDRTEDVGE